MRTTSVTRAATAAAVALVTLTLTACGGDAVAQGSDRQPTVAQHTQSSTEAPVTVAPTAEEVDAVTRVDASGPGEHAFVLSDGREVLVVDGEPLPEEVVADVLAPVLAAEEELGERPDVNGVLEAAAREAVARINDGTGVQAVVAYHGADAAGAYYVALDVAEPTRSRGEALTAARTFIDGQADPSAWVLLDATED
ncbi:hypothetical protein FBY24_1465 [Cellulomonas sp. SLBN-39]|nr:hypothetical protein FBY24_1465 [Cellulomonas sp. SLBN-39]